MVVACSFEVMAHGRAGVFTPIRIRCTGCVAIRLSNCKEGGKLVLGNTPLQVIRKKSDFYNLFGGKIFGNSAFCILFSLDFVQYTD